MQDTITKTSPAAVDEKQLPEPAVSGEVDAHQLTEAEARELTDQAREQARELWGTLLRLYEGGAHLALGYRSWGGYFREEFGESAGQAYRLLRAARVEQEVSVHVDTGDATEAHMRALAPLNDEERRHLVAVVAHAGGFSSYPAAKLERLARAFKDATGKLEQASIGLNVIGQRDAAAADDVLADGSWGELYEVMSATARISRRGEQRYVEALERHVDQLDAGAARDLRRRLAQAIMVLGLAEQALRPRERAAEVLGLPPEQPQRKVGEAVREVGGLDLGKKKALPKSRRRTLAASVQRVILGELEHVPRGTGVLLSSGVDSNTVLRGMIELDRAPVALSFGLAGRESTDLRVALEVAAALGVEHHTVVLSTDLEELRAYVAEAINEYGLKDKAPVECFWPRRAAIEEAVRLGLPALTTGDGGDGYHALGREAARKGYTKTAEKMDEFRRGYFTRPNWAQTETIRRYAAERGLEVLMPLAAPALLDVFEGLSFEEVNRPHEKVLLREAFDLADLPRRSNLQLGDSGIADLFKQLAPAGERSPSALAGLYRRLARDAA